MAFVRKGTLALPLNSINALNDNWVDQLSWCDDNVKNLVLPIL